MADNRIPARASLSSDEAAGEKSDVKDGSATLPEIDNKSEEGIVREDGGVTRIDALYLVFGKGWGLYSLWGSIAVIAYVYSLSRSTTGYYAPFATSAYGEHTIIGTIGVINGVLAGVAPPFIAKLADVWSRPHALTLSVILYAVGYAMVAGSRNITTVVAGQVVYTLGNTGITFLNSLLIADITSLQWRPFVDGMVNLPYVLNAFVAGFIVDGVNGYSANGWRWGYGMFCILLPVAMAPALAVLLIGDRRAKQLGVLSLAASSRARRMQLGEETDTVNRTKWQSFRHYWTRLNAFGLLLMGFAFALILTPITLSTTATGGYKNPSLIAMLVCGGILFVAWCIWDGFFSEYPFMPKRVFNRTFIACVGADFFYFFGTYLIDTYFSSWVYVIVDWSDRDIAFFNNTSSVALCGFAFLGGLGMRYTRNYKYWQIGGLLVRCIGQGLVYQSAKTPTTAILVSSQVFIGLGGSVSVIASYIGVQGSLSHQDMAIGTAVLNLWASVGSSISIAISSTVWNKQVPAKLEQYLGPTHNSTEIATIFGSIYAARLAEPRELVKQSYLESVDHLWMAGLIVTCLAVVSASFAKNFRLGESHNNVELNKVIKFRDQHEIDEELSRMKAAQAEAEAKL